MAKRSAQDTAAAKAKKQKIILIVGGVLLLAARRVPGAEADEARRVGRRSAAGCRPERDGHTRAGRSHGRPRQGLRRRRGRCRCRAAAAVKVETSQLASFTLFEVKDPFVQQVGRSRPPTPTRTSGRSGAPARRERTRRRRPAPPARRPPGQGQPPAAPAPIIYATIDFNSKPQQVRGQGHVPDARAAVRPPLADEEAGEDQRRRRIVRRWPARDPEARQEGDARQHGDRRPLRAEARLHRRAARGHRGIHDRCEQERSDDNEAVINRALRRPLDAAVRLQRNQRPGKRALGRDPRR